MAIPITWDRTELVQGPFLRTDSRLRPASIPTRCLLTLMDTTRVMILDICHSTHTMRYHTTRTHHAILTRACTHIIIHRICRRKATRKTRHRLNSRTPCHPTALLRFQVRRHT